MITPELNPVGVPVAQRLQAPRPAVEAPLPGESFQKGDATALGLMSPGQAGPSAAVTDAAPVAPPPALRNRQVLVQDAGIDEMPCERVGSTSVMRDGQPVAAEVFRVEHPDEDEAYKLRVGDKMVGYITLGHYTTEDGQYAGLDDCPEWSPLARFDGKLYADKLMIEMMSSPGQLEGYSQIGTRLHQIAVERMLAEGYDGIGLISSWNAQGFHYKSGYRGDDYAGIPDGKTSDDYIRRQIERSPDDPHTEALGCIQMYLPEEAIAQRREQIARHPILEKGEARLTDLETGAPVTARVVSEKDPFGLETYKLVVGEEVVGDVALNYFRNDAQGYRDVVGSYGLWSPFARYGNGAAAEFNVEKMYLELDNSPGEGRYGGIQESLYQIAIEASLARGGQGRVQIEGDWNDHAWLYEYGFRTQDFAGLTRGGDIDRYIERELSAAKAEGRPPVCKGLGSINMKLTREMALQHWDEGLKQPILG